MSIYSIIFVCLAPQDVGTSNKPTKNPSNLQKNNKCLSGNVKKGIETRNSKMSINSENSAKNTLGSSFLSKFDEINSFPSSPPNKIRPSSSNFNQAHPYHSKNSQETHGKNPVNKWTKSFQFNYENSKKTLSKKNSKKCIVNDENDKENRSTLRNALSVDVTFQDFKPAFTSSPLEIDDINLSDQRNKNMFKIPAYPKKYDEHFHQKLSESNSKRPKVYQNKSQSESDEAIQNIAPSSKVRQLVKEVIDSQNKLQSINCTNKENIVFYLKPEGWTRVFNKSQIENGNGLRDNNENSNKIVGFNIAVKHNNITTVRGRLPELQKTLPGNSMLDSSFSSCVSIGCQTGSEMHDSSISENNNVSNKSNNSIFMNPNLKNVIKRLKIGVSLYGCNFQVIKINLLLI